MADGQATVNPAVTACGCTSGRTAPPTADERAAFAQASARLQMWAWRQDFNTGIDRDILLAPKNLPVADWVSLFLQLDIFDTVAIAGEYQIRLVTALLDVGPGDDVWQELVTWTNLPTLPGDSIVLSVTEANVPGLLDQLQWQIRHNGVSTGTLAFQIKVFFKGRVGASVRAEPIRFASKSCLSNCPAPRLTRAGNDALISLALAWHEAGLVNWANAVMLHVAQQRQIAGL